ncbi:uncharacterized protein J3R85_015849 [Psidium guajava]|nr:uncharacterized protein J3R85_015849 [Psidium guajava]
MTARRWWLAQRERELVVAGWRSRAGGRVLGGRTWRSTTVAVEGQSVRGFSEGLRARTIGRPLIRHELPSK